MEDIVEKDVDIGRIAACRKCTDKNFITMRKCVKIRTLAFKNSGRKCVKFFQKMFVIQKFLLPLQPIN